MRSALQLRGNAEAKEFPFVSISLFFLGGGSGFYLRSACSYEQSEVERRLPLRRATHSQLPKADPPPSACSC